MKGAIKWVCWLALAAPALGQQGVTATCEHRKTVSDFTGEATHLLTCSTEDAHFVMQCEPGENSHAMAFFLVTKYMEAEGDRIKMEYSIDRGKIAGDGETAVFAWNNERKAQLLTTSEAAGRFNGYFLKAEQLAVRSKLRYYGTRTAIFRFGSSFHAAYADYVNACGYRGAERIEKRDPLSDEIEWRGDTPYWRGVEVAEENRCSPYNRSDYGFSRSEYFEQAIIQRDGGIITSLYEEPGYEFESADELHINHVVALAEAHDSGLCGKTDEERKAFGRDIRNMTFAEPGLNAAKADLDFAEWLPVYQLCEFANRYLSVKREHGLSIDGAELEKLANVMRNCEQ